MKLLFLDVDGVLNHRNLEWDRMDTLDPVCVERVKRIVEAAGALIILSSTWRLSEHGRAVIATALAPVPIHDVTPCIHVRLHQEEKRRVEIRELLDRYPQATTWAVLDDDTDADLQDGSYFRTYFEGGGLTESICQQVIAYLNAPTAEAA